MEPRDGLLQVACRSKRTDEKQSAERFAWRSHAYKQKEKETLQMKTDETKIEPDQALHDLTLEMIYLTRFKESGHLRSDDQLFRAWKSYDWDTLDKLSEEELINVMKGDMSLVGTSPPTEDEWGKYKYHHFNM